MSETLKFSLVIIVSLCIVAIVALGFDYLREKEKTRQDVTKNLSEMVKKQNEHENK